MKKHQISLKLISLIALSLIIVSTIFAIGCYFFFAGGGEGKHEQRAGDVYIIGDEVVYTGYFGSGEAYS